MYAWYFSKTDCKLRYDDNRQIRTGITHKVKGVPGLCRHGLHASKRIIDALSYARGPVVWLVKLRGTIVMGDDKCAATERTYIAKLNDEKLLREFARRCALEVIYMWNAPDVVVEYLKTGNEDLRAEARAAARAAAGIKSEDAARDASRSAARSASWAAIQKVARAAARGAAEAKCEHAAQDAVRYAAWAATRAAGEDAARAAGEDAARYAGEGVITKKFNDLLTGMVLEKMKLPEGVREELYDESNSCL